MADSHDATVSRLWGELAGSLRVWFARQIGDEHVADDLTSECFLRVHDRLEDVRDEERLAGWIRGIARHLLVDWRRGRRDAAEEDVADLAAPEHDSNLDGVVASWMAPMIDTLEEPDRQTLRLTELEGLTHSEAAARLGISVRALKSRVLRGRARLRARILSCCELEFDRRGGIVAWRRRSSVCCDERRPG